MYNITRGEIMDLAKFLRSYDIELFSVLDFKDVLITDACKLQRYEEFTPKSLLILAIPYLHTVPENNNISLYALGRDYHLFFKNFFGKLIAHLLSEFPQNTFLPFADSSPIDERHAAARACLGILGKNGLLITEKYGSYVFLGEIISDIEPRDWGIPCHTFPIEDCIGCGACIDACPKTNCGECLSAITQKKGEISFEESQLMIKYGTAWGCDICQRVCPHNQNVATSTIDFFKHDLIPCLDSETVNKMTKEEFKQRAWSWRGKATILRNLALFEKVKNDDVEG